ncbi:glycosyltransferase [Phormidesmis priestleyi ULC007]|uniref:Glycosyltransferase n=1 Tax=Phormidesmis priestleyi ULC007 TaxID=1920490 RepID=A0A2T1DC10_9CYAN|nr:glycosyltransferase family 2 protein [Phormidesmis priestleyi]PSB17993.1 glycosyltransferase [Phormidesmis priestleyi ULC007]PZO49333.1 MAG: glycosyltransferase [Phormidesmis priestleyi]
MSLKFSVITPSYSQGRFIERTIQSVLKQDADIEYVICDGGSKDETVEILKRYEDRLRWVSEPDRGQSDAVNKGLAMTKGEIIAWINSDDVYYSGAFRQVQAVFEAHPEVEIIYGNADYIDEYDRLIEPYPTEAWNYKRLTRVCYLCQPAVFFRRSLVEKYGNLDVALDYCMDYELWLRYGKHIKFYYLPKKLAASRLYKTNKTLGQRLAVCTEINDMLRREIGIVPSHWIFCYSHVKLDQTLKLDRTQPEQERQFINELVKISFWSYWHWKSLISPKAITKIFLWWVAANAIVLKTPIRKGRSVLKRVAQPVYETLTNPLYKRIKSEVVNEVHNEVHQELKRIRQNNLEAQKTHLELQSQLAQKLADELIHIYMIVIDVKHQQSNEKLNVTVLDELAKLRESIQDLSMTKNNDRE